MRPELVGHFDLKILLLVSEKTVLSRAVNRDSFLGSKEEILKKYALRYTPGEKLYFEDAKPLEKADIVIDNNDFENPEIVKI
jgi:uridine kinase